MDACMRVGAYVCVFTCRRNAFRHRRGRERGRAGAVQPIRRHRLHATYSGPRGGGDVLGLRRSGHDLQCTAGAAVFSARPVVPGVCAAGQRLTVPSHSTRAALAAYVCVASQATLENHARRRHYTYSNTILSAPGCPFPRSRTLLADRLLTRTTRCVLPLARLMFLFPGDRPVSRHGLDCP